MGIRSELEYTGASTTSQHSQCGTHYHRHKTRSSKKIATISYLGAVKTARRLPRIFHETVWRDRKDGRATGSSQGPRVTPEQE